MVEKYLSSESLFKRWLQNHLRRRKKIKFGYDDGYYRKIYWVRESEEGGIQGLKVVMEWNNYNNDKIHAEFLSWEAFYEMVRSKKVEDEEVSLMELMERAVKEVHTE